MGKILYTLAMLSLPLPLFSICISANCEDHTISVIDTDSWNVLRSIEVGKNPRELAWNPSSKKLFVSNSGSKTISCVTLSNDTVQEISLDSEPRGLSLSKDGKNLYVVLKNENEVLVLNTDSFKQETKYAVGKGPRNVVINEYRTCSSNNEDDSITIYENNNPYTHRFEDGTRPYGLYATDNTLYITSIGKNAVILFDMEKKIEIAKVIVGRHPTALQLHPTKPLLYATALDDNSISVINLHTLSMQETILVGRNPFGLTLSPDGKYLAITNNGDNMVTILDTDTHQIVRTLSVGRDPHGVLWFQ